LAQALPELPDELTSLRLEVERLRDEHRRLERTVSELRDAVAARDEFIGVAGHELRNAMGGIVVAITNVGAHARKKGDLPPWAGQRMELMVRQARSFVRRATTLIDVSRLASGGMPLQRERVRLADVVGVILHELGPEAERAGCALSVVVDRRVVGRWDRAALEQVAYNLVSNAIRYGAGKPIGIGISLDGTKATLTVRDCGRGITEPDSKRLFARFEQAVPRGAHSGFGMGLWIARQLVVAHGGEIAVQSAPEAGSLFTVTLPGAVHEIGR
jgi:two-component system, OmpR family, sensor kinase